MVSLDSVTATIYRVREVYDTENIDDYLFLLSESVKNLPGQVNGFVRCWECAKWNYTDCPMYQEMFGRNPLTDPDGYCYLAEVNEDD